MADNWNKSKCALSPPILEYIPTSIMLDAVIAGSSKVPEISFVEYLHPALVCRIPTTCRNLTLTRIVAPGDEVDSSQFRRCTPPSRTETLLIVQGL